MTGYQSYKKREDPPVWFYSHSILRTSEYAVRKSYRLFLSEYQPSHYSTLPCRRESTAASNLDRLSTLPPGVDYAMIVRISESPCHGSLWHTDELSSSFPIHKMGVSPLAGCLAAYLYGLLGRGQFSPHLQCGGHFVLSRVPIRKSAPALESGCFFGPRELLLGS